MTEDIFKDKETLLRIWENERNTRDLAVKLMWENLKFFSIFIGTLLAAYIGFFDFIARTLISPDSIYAAILNGIILFPIPVTIFVLALYAYNDLEQRRERFYLVVTHLLKLEDLLGLHEKIDDKLGYLKKDQYLFAQYQKKLVEYKKNFDEGKDDEGFKKCQMKEKSAFRS